MKDSAMQEFIRKFSEITQADVAEVGGKNSSLGEMFTQLLPRGIRIPDGFAITSSAFKHFLDHNRLSGELPKLMEQLNKDNFSNLKEIGGKARKMMIEGIMPDDLTKDIIRAYKELSRKRYIEVAVRSSATAEDLPEASFAGQHESYLNIKGPEKLVTSVQKCFASLYTDRAIKYREDHKFEHRKVLISVGVQKMVRSDKACAGVGFTLETESGFRDVIHLAGVWGLGENIVQGAVTPDEFLVFKPSLLSNKQSIIQKRMGDKAKTMIYAAPDHATASTVNRTTPREKRKQFVLTDDEIITLARWAYAIEEHYKKPMDIEWAKDGRTKELFIVQARPETVHSQKDPYTIKEYRLAEEGERIATGEAIGSKIAVGIARILESPKNADKLKEGEIIVTDITSPDWDPLLKKSAGIITNKGGRTSHASIVARELGIPAIVGCGDATKKISDGQEITVSCAQGKEGYVYPGKLKFEEIEHNLRDIKKPDYPQVMMILGEPDQAFKLSFYPNDGIGLMRIEFIITHFIGVHPMALVKFDELEDKKIKQKIADITYLYADKNEFFTDRLAEGIATIAAAFYPKDVLVRMSDFKTNEYANLLGGKQFEPAEENPMLGFRGASRYYHEKYKDGFRLECDAIKKVREQMGLTNVKVMIPFCRTVDEADKIIALMDENELSRDNDPSFNIYMMVEIPSNVVLADEFAKRFDGFSIGSNDLTQLMLGIDRDSSIVADLFDEQNKAVKDMIASVIKKAKESHIKIGLCGQVPSDFPEFAGFLVEQGIDSISFNPDALLKGIENINRSRR
jgi:pyruvate, water dikinase